MLFENPIVIGLVIVLVIVLTAYIGYKLLGDIKLIFTKNLQVKWVKKPQKPEKEPKERSFPIWFIGIGITIGMCCVIAAICGILIVTKLFIEAS